MMDRIFGQAVWSWGKSPEPQEGPKYEQVVKLDTTIKVFYDHLILPALVVGEYLWLDHYCCYFCRLGITECLLP
jgi:hypothetical protein